MPQAINCVPILFADDTCLIFTALNLASLTTFMNKELAQMVGGPDGFLNWPRW